MIHTQLIKKYYHKITANLGKNYIKIHKMTFIYVNFNNRIPFTMYKIKILNHEIKIL